MPARWDNSPQSAKEGHSPVRQLLLDNDYKIAALPTPPPFVGTGGVKTSKPP